MTYKNLMDLHDGLLMGVLTKDIPEAQQIEFMDKFESACKTADEWLFQEQLPILLGTTEKAQAVKQHMDDQIVWQ